MLYIEFLAFLFAVYFCTRKNLHYSATHKSRRGVFPVQGFMDFYTILKHHKGVLQESAQLFSWSWTEKQEATFATLNIDSRFPQIVILGFSTTYIMVKIRGFQGFGWRYKQDILLRTSKLINHFGSWGKKFFKYLYLFNCVQYCNSLQIFFFYYFYFHLQSRYKLKFKLVCIFST